MTNAQVGMKIEAYKGSCIGLLIQSTTWQGEIKTFVYTNQSTAVMENLHKFAAAGCTMQGLCTITRRERRWGKEEPYEVIGIRFEIN